MKKKLLIVILILAIGSGIFVYLQWNKPHRDPEKEKGLAVSAEQLFNDYEQNETTANGQYLNKTLEISGIVIDKGQNQEGTPTLMLEAGRPMSGVQLTFNIKFKDKLADLNVGDKIVAKGICTGFLTDVIITDAVLLEK